MSTVVEDCRALGSDWLCPTFGSSGRIRGTPRFSPLDFERLAEILATQARPAARHRKVQEEVAIHNNRTAVQDYGQRFLELAETVHRDY